jgi:hypothetical protein
LQQRITLTEQLGEGEEIELVALQARLDERRARIPVRARSSRLSYKDEGTNRAQMLAHSRT